MHSQFTVAGMSSSTSSHHNPNVNPWGSTSTGGPITSSFSDSLSQSRSHYQSGYLMSSQSNNVPQGNQRVDEVPVVQTKAKMNQILSRGSANDFGMDSMFQSSRQRQALADEDAPPTSSIHDIPNEINLEPSPARFQPRRVNDRGLFSSSRRPTNAASPTTNQTSEPVYIIVFGYPPDKYSLTVEYFKSLGDSTDPDPNNEVSNCFRIGYRNAGDAMRAVRKNGEILGGSWMVGAKWADQNQAELMNSQPQRSALASPNTTHPNNQHFPESSPNRNNIDSAMAVDDPWAPSYNHNPSSSSLSTNPSVGTPLTLAPSLAAFRKTPAVASSPATPQRSAVAPTTWGTGLLSTPVLGAGVPGPGPNAAGGVGLGLQASPNKGFVNQMSDLIFGW